MKKLKIAFLCIYSHPSIDGVWSRVSNLSKLLVEKGHEVGIFSTNKIGYTKSQKEYWQKIYEKLGKPNKKSVLCWDDEEKNIQSAKNFGFLAELYTDFNNYKNKINDIIK